MSYFKFASGNASTLNTEIFNCSFSEMVFSLLSVCMTLLLGFSESFIY